MKHVIFILLSLVLSCTVFSQDKIILINGGQLQVEKIDSISSDLLYYRSGKESTFTMPFKLISGYHLTIPSKKNLSKKFHKRATAYFEIHNIVGNDLDHQNFSTDYINSRVPSDLSVLKYSPGYYVKHNGDIIKCDLASLESKLDRSIFCIAKEANNEFNIMLADQILSYNIDHTLYESFDFNLKNGEPFHQFIECLIEGDINYYIKRPTPLNEFKFTLTSKGKSGKYYLYFPDEKAEIYFNTDSKKTVIRGGRNGSPVTSFVAQNLNNSFIEIMSILVDDCPITSYKVKNNFYTGSTLEDLIQEYNRCEN